MGHRQLQLLVDDGGKQLGPCDVGDVAQLAQDALRLDRAPIRTRRQLQQALVGPPAHRQLRAQQCGGRLRLARPVREGFAQRGEGAQARLQGVLQAVLGHLPLEPDEGQVGAIRRVVQHRPLRRAGRVSTAASATR